MKKIIYLFKNLFFSLRIGNILGVFASPFIFIGYMLQVSRFISKHKNKGIINDTFTFKRDFQRRYKLFGKVSEVYALDKSAINYLEFGVATGTTLKWWLKNNHNPNSLFYGFDTFEGLPENWGIYKAGDMNFNIPDITDSRSQLIKGLFQETLNNFLRSHDIQKSVTVVHLDADLFSATLFVLGTIDSYLKPGDLIFFDEFNVPNHEFLAFKCYSSSFYRKLEFVGAVNNCYQVAFRVI